MLSISHNLLFFLVDFYMYERFISCIKRGKTLSFDFLKMNKRLFILGALLILLGIVLGITSKTNGKSVELLTYSEKMQTGEYSAFGVTFKFLLYSLIFFAFAYFSSIHFSLFVVLNLIIVVYASFFGAQLYILGAFGGLYGVIDIIVIYIPVCVFFYGASSVTLIKVYNIAGFEGNMRKKTRFFCFRDELLKTLVRIYLTYVCFLLVWYLVFCNILRVFIVVF